MITTVLLAGGEGKRLWPLSTPDLPKQFIKLISSKSMFQHAIENILEISKGPIIIIANERHYSIIISQLSVFKNEPIHILFEKDSFNTAIAIATACTYIKMHFMNSYIAIFPCDHYIENIIALKQEIEQLYYISIKHINLFGIKPHKAETNYGYVKKGTKTFYKANSYTIECFTEKPIIDLAIKYSNSEDYLWNSGIIFASNNILLRQINLHANQLLTFAKEAIRNSSFIGINILLLSSIKLPKNLQTSIDYILFEKANNMRISQIDLKWSDLGSWESLAKFITIKQSHINIKNILFLETQKSISISNNNQNKTWALQELDCEKEFQGDLLYSAGICATIESTNRSNNKSIDSNQFTRPWGCYEVIKKDRNFQIKILKLELGGKTSLQSHQHRDENWTIINGKAKIILDDKIIILEQGNQICISKHIKHRVENIGEQILEILELQTGNYIDEDDIVRFDDDYGRTSVK